MSENSRPLTMEALAFVATLADEAGRDVRYYISLRSDGVWIGPQHDSDAPSAFLTWPALYAAAAKERK